MTTQIKTNDRVTHEIVGGVHRFTFPGVGVLEFDPQKASAANRLRAEVYGWKQRIADAAAIPFNKEAGRYATSEEKFKAMRALVEHYESGTEGWARGRVSGAEDKAKSETTLTLHALAEQQGLSPAEMRERVKGLAKKREMSVRAYLEAALEASRRANEDQPISTLAVIYERLKAAQTTAPVKLNADELANELARGVE